MTIDVDRGVSIRQIVAFDKVNNLKFQPDPKFGGLTVYMYLDTPGVYLDVHERAIPEALAEMAGFDVKTLAKQRHKREALAAFDAKLKAEMEIDVEEEEILAQMGDWKVIALPLERAKVVDIVTGEAVTAVPMPKADALILLASLVGVAQDNDIVAQKAAAASAAQKGK